MGFSAIYSLVLGENCSFEYEMHGTFSGAGAAFFHIISNWWGFC